MAEREVRYCTTEDGVRIAYCVEGEGPALVFCPGFVESFSLDHLVPEEAEFMAHVGAGRKVIRYDIRGTGLSQRDVEDLSSAALVRDLDAVIEASELRQCYIWASTISGPRVIEYAADHPWIVAGLALYGTFARARDVVSPEALSSMAEFIRTNPELAIRTLIGTNAELLGGQAALHGAHLAEVYGQSAKADVVARLLVSGYADSDVLDLLPRVHTPALVIHRMDDVVVPFALGQQLASELRNASLLPLEGSIHPYTLGDTEPLLAALDAFIPAAVTRPNAKPSDVHIPSDVRVVLFTDLVGHTEMMQRLGDEAGRGVLREHERITREVLKDHGGQEIKTMGDGFMASFGSVTRSVECAMALQRAFDLWNEERVDAELLVRVGLNAGEPIEEEGDLFGASVILAARVAARAAGGEILIPEPVRHLLAGKQFLFSDRGAVVLKGFEDAVRLYEVRWRD